MSTEDTTKLIEASRHIASELRFGPVVTRTQITALADAVESLVAENEKLRSAENESHESWERGLRAHETLRGRNKRLRAERDALRAENEKLRAERDEFKRLFGECHPVHLDGVQEARRLQAQLDNMTVEWGVTWPNGDATDAFDSEEDARAWLAQVDEYALVKRQVGPWVGVSE